MRALLEVYCDGGCKVGKGIGAATYLFVRGEGIQFIHTTPLKKDGLTNNQAEYTAVYLAVLEAGVGKYTLFSDSEVVVKQLNGGYKVKEKNLLTLYKAVKETAPSVEFVNVPRENKYIMICDKMNKMMMEMI